MKQIKIILLLFTIVLISCNDTENLINNDKFPISIEYTEIGKGTLTGTGLENIDKTYTIIKNNIDWNNLISKMNSIENVSSTFKLSKINFETHFIIATILEVKSSAWEVKIKKITENVDNVNVYTEETNHSILTYSQPFHIVLIPKTEKNILFK